MRGGEYLNIAHANLLSVCTLNSKALNPKSYGFGRLGSFSKSMGPDFGGPIKEAPLLGNREMGSVRELPTSSWGS